MGNPTYHWQLMDDINPVLHEKFNALSAQINHDQALPDKYRELIILGMVTVLRSAPAVKTHAAAAYEKYGATKEEIFCTLATALTIGGVPAYREACLNLEEFLSQLK